MNLKQTNNFITEQFSYYDFKEEISRPLLVTTDESYKMSVQNKILYIGQETNGWGNHDVDFSDIEEERKYIENIYYNFLYNRCATKKTFWQFIKQTLEIDRTELKDNIIWSNAFIAGKCNSKGLTEYHAEIDELSVKYLTFLYEYFEPKATIIVSGPKTAYASNIEAFLKSIGKEIDRPNTEQLLTHDQDIFWTYHPNYLNFNSRKNEISEKIKQFVK